MWIRWIRIRIRNTAFFGDLMLNVAIKFYLKRYLDFDMTIFGFCQHLGPFFLQNVWITFHTSRVMSSLPYIYA
jgi:hypothetical protein